ncbi:Cytochrome b5 domain-containing protein 1, partial [Phytophthora boehmeriae]
RDPQYVVGRLTKKVRWLEIVNVLTQQQHSLEVCCEETLAEIQRRYLRVNAHAGSYTWKHLEDDEFVPLHMQQTLDENGIPDESPIFERFDMDEHQFKPILHLYFDDDLTVM